MNIIINLTPLGRVEAFIDGMFVPTIWAVKCAEALQQISVSGQFECPYCNSFTKLLSDGSVEAHTDYVKEKQCTASRLPLHAVMIAANPLE